MSWVIRDPRIRALLLLALVLLGLALAWHLTGEHLVSVGACLGVLVALLLLPGPSEEDRIVVLERVATITRIPEPLVPNPGRHPPDEGTLLRL